MAKDIPPEEMTNRQIFEEVLKTSECVEAIKLLESKGVSSKINIRDDGIEVTAFLPWSAVEPLIAEARAKTQPVPTFDEVQMNASIGRHGYHPFDPDLYARTTPTICRICQHVQSARIHAPLGTVGR